MSKLKAILCGSAAVFIAIITIFVSGILLLRHENLAGIPDVGKPSLAVSSPDFSDGGPIPKKFACDKGASPALAWFGPPAATRSFAVVMEDPDAPLGFIHCVVYDLPAETRALAEGASSRSLPNGARMGKNGYGNVGYVGPCPPFGTHHYVFHVYAVDLMTSLPPGASKKQIMAVLKGHVLAQGTLVGIYGRQRE